jgi:hypothetical protein
MSSETCEACSVSKPNDPQWAAANALAVDLILTINKHKTRLIAEGVETAIVNRLIRAGLGTAQVVTRG